MTPVLMFGFAMAMQVASHNPCGPMVHSPDVSFEQTSTSRDCEAYIRSFDDLRPHQQNGKVPL